jgi:predicted restriction endonuclease
MDKKGESWFLLEYEYLERSIKTLNNPETGDYVFEKTIEEIENPYIIIPESKLGKKMSLYKVVYRYKTYDDAIFDMDMKTAWVNLDIEASKCNRILKAQKRKSREAKVRKTKKKSFKSLRIKVFERDNYRCQICGRSAKDGINLEVDHIIPRAKGGKDEMTNLHVLCEDCNRSKSAKILPNLLEQYGLEY